MEKRRILRNEISVCSREGWIFSLSVRKGVKNNSKMPNNSKIPKWSLHSTKI